MKKIFLLFVLLFWLISFSYTNAAMCTTWYTELNVISPNLNDTISTSNNAWFSWNINNIAHYIWKRWIVCYRILWTTPSGYYNIYYWSWSSWWRLNWNNMYVTNWLSYEFVEPNYIPEIWDLTLNWGNFSNYWINITWINDTSSGQPLSIYYSWDGLSYTKSNITANTPVNSWSLTFYVNAEWKTINNNLLYVKINDWKVDSNIKTINVNTWEIYIDHSMMNSYNKVIKSSSNWGDLYYSFTSSWTCDSSLGFLNYTDLSLSDPSLNWSYVCYKSILNLVENFKLSNVIEWIYLWNTTPVKNSNLFDNFLKWKKWNLKDFDPLYILITSQISSTVQWTSTSKNYPKMLTDVNWDWLPDLLFTNYIYAYAGPTPGSTIWNWEPQYYYALLLNKWNMDFEVKYRCVYLSNQTAWSDTSRVGYYWDCVQ